MASAPGNLALKDATKINETVDAIDTAHVSAIDTTYQDETSFDGTTDSVTSETNSSDVRIEIFCFYSLH